MTAPPKIKAGTLVAEWLETIGQHKRAEDVRALVRSASSLRETASRRTMDLYALRDRMIAAGLDPFPKEPTDV